MTKHNKRLILCVNLNDIVPCCNNYYWNFKQFVPLASYTSGSQPTTSKQLLDLSVSNITSNMAQQVILGEAVSRT